MIVADQFVEVKWNWKTKKHYEEKGYSFTNNGDSFTIKVSDLMKASAIKVNVICDFCNDIISKPYGRYTREVDESNALHTTHYDSCVNCYHKKSKLKVKYKLSKSDEIKLIDMYKNSTPLSILRDKFKVTDSNIYSILNKNKIERLRKEWTDLDSEKLVNLYELESWEVILRELSDFTKGTIIQKANERGLYRANPYTEEELEILYDNYKTTSNREMIDLLPNRTEKSIQTKASRLNINKWEFWSDEEKEKLNNLYPLYPNSTLVQFFNGRSEYQLNDMASSMGIHKSNEANLFRIEKLKGELLDDLILFAKDLGRTPTIDEINFNSSMSGASSYVRHFGSYTDVCKLAGLNVNTSLFGKSFITKSINGDVCLSKKEKEITDLLIMNDIKYEKEKLYRNIIPNGVITKNIRCDWFINDKVLVEYFGMPEKENYKIRMNEKIDICKNNNVPFIELYKSDMKNNYSGLIQKFSEHSIVLNLQNVV